MAATEKTNILTNCLIIVKGQMKYLFFDIFMCGQLF